MSCGNPRSMIALWLLLLAATLLSACGEKEEPDPGDDPGTYLPIAYGKSGGMAGVDQRVEIAGAGTVRVSLDGEPLHVTADVDPALAARAQRAVADIDFARLEVPAASPAPDEFTIELSYGSDTIRGDESRMLALEPLAPALSALDAVLGDASATARPAAGGGSSPG